MKEKIAAAILSASLLIAGWLMHGTAPRFGQAQSGSQASVATTSVSTFAVGGINTLVATSTCSSITVTTQGGYLELTFSDYAGQSPSPTFGIYQAASTTVSYDGGLVGCGLVKAYSSAAQTITVLRTN